MTMIYNTYWWNNPTILLHKDTVLEIFPTSAMTYERKINAISRLIILLSLLGCIFTMSLRFLFIGIISLFLIFIISQKHSPPTTSMQKPVEGFTSEKQLLNPETLTPFLKKNFQTTSQDNPMSNVLLTQIYDTPERLAAPPSFNNEVYEDITLATKKMVQELNPSIQNTNKQLFGDLGEKFGLDQSLRNFYSTPNTRVCNDQGAYAQFLYGNMPSSHDSNAAAAMERVKDSYRYTLY